MNAPARASSEDHGLLCHASCIVLGEDGVLIRGPSGSGKSSFCLELLVQADRAGRHAGLVGDDRVALALHHGRIVARAHPAIAGLIEVRGLGLFRNPLPVAAAVIRLVVDLVEDNPRLPPAALGVETVLGVDLPRLALEPRHPRSHLLEQVLRAARREGIVSPRSHSAAALSPVHLDV